MKLPLLLLGAIALSGCSHKPPEPHAANAVAASVSAPWDGMQKDKQRAQEVQKMVNQHTDDQRKRIEAAGQ